MILMVIVLWIAK